MSSMYSMNVTIKDYKLENEKAIIKRLKYSWGYDVYTWNDPPYMNLTGTDTLSAKTEAEFAREVAEAAWDENGGYCSVEVIATYLEELPYEMYEFGANEYKEWLIKSGARDVNA